MTQFQLLKEGNKAGWIDVTNKGVMIIDDQELADIFDDAGFDFVRTEFYKDGMKTNYFFRATVPTETMIEILVRLESNLYGIGYEIIEYPSRLKSSSVHIGALS